MKKKFNAGDKVRVKEGRARFPQGMVLTVKHGPAGSLSGGNYSFEETDGIVLGDNLELVEKKRKKSERISALESEVEKLKAEVQALKQAQEPPISPQSVEEMTPNERRADVIKRAKAFVGEGSDRWFGGNICVVEYVVNHDKRTVVALVRGKRHNDLQAKGVAKCDPDDVFNVDIGKAIALTRAFKCPMPGEFVKAVQPTEAVVGMVARVMGNAHPYVAKIIRESGRRHSIVALKRDPEDLRKILEDTDADYNIYAESSR